MYKNQLQELAQRSCFNLPSYSCIREGPDHAPRFKATVNFNGETFESPSFCSTLRQAEHAAAEIALNTLANRGPSKALAAKILDETGVYKNLLQETAHRAGLNLPIYTTVRSGPGHVPVFSCTVELAGLTFSGEPAKTKKQAQKNAAMSAWSTLKQLAQRGLSSTSPSAPLESELGEEQEQVVIARVLSTLQPPKPNNTTRNGPQNGPPRPTHNSPDLNPTPSSLSPIQYTNWAYYNFPTEMAMYRMWQQAQLSQHQSGLLSLPVPPPLPLPAPQVLPFMPSVFHPDQLYFAQEHTVGPTVTVSGSSPSFYISNNSSPTPSLGRSKVTIQEIQEEKTEEPSQEEPKTGETDQVEPGPSPTGQYARAQPSQIEFKLQNLRVGEPSQCNTNIRPHHSSPGPGFRRVSEPAYPAPAPVRNRTLGSVSNVGPRPQNLASPVRAPPGMRTGGAQFLTRPRVGFGVPSRFMAPAVQIRSVVPVCSAPPLRNMTGSSQEGKSADQEKKRGGKEEARRQ
ncbi:hypothetical protein LguiA_010902 [Lonicera macranthoides]